MTAALSAPCCGLVQPEQLRVGDERRRRRLLRGRGYRACGTRATRQARHKTRDGGHSRRQQNRHRHLSPPNAARRQEARSDASHRGASGLSLGGTAARPTGVVVYSARPVTIDGAPGHRSDAQSRSAASTSFHPPQGRVQPRVFQRQMKWRVSASASAPAAHHQKDGWRRYRTQTVTMTTHFSSRNHSGCARGDGPRALRASRTARWT